MPSNYYHAHQKHTLSESRVSLQDRHNLLFGKCSSLQRALALAVDPSTCYKLQYDIKLIQEELEQVRLQLETVLLELDRLDQLPDPLPPPDPPSHPDSPPPIKRIKQRTNTQLSSPPKRRSFAVNSTPIESSIFVLLMVGIWLFVGLSSGKLEDAHASKTILLGLAERDIVPVLPGAFGGLISGLLGALTWSNSTRYRNQAQTILMGMSVGMVSGALVWATIWTFVRDSPGNSASQNLICGAIFGLVVSITVLLCFDLKRTRL